MFNGSLVIDGSRIEQVLLDVSEKPFQPCLKPALNILSKSNISHIFCSGMAASSPSLFTSLLLPKVQHPFIIVLDDLEEAGYFYYDLVQLLGEKDILFFPSSFRRAIKYGQKDAANEILRTEVLSALQKDNSRLCIVTYPDALAEKVISRKKLEDNTLSITVGEKVDMELTISPRIFFATRVIPV